MDSDPIPALRNLDSALASAGPVLAPGARVVIRDAEWVIRRVDRSPDGGYQVVCDGVSELVREREAIFLTTLESDIQVLDPADTRLVPDESPGLPTADCTWRASSGRRSSKAPEPPPAPTSLFDSDLAYCEAALHRLREKDRTLRFESDVTGTVLTLDAPENLQRRFSYFPREVSPENGRFALTADGLRDDGRTGGLVIYSDEIYQCWRPRPGVAGNRCSRFRPGIPPGKDVRMKRSARAADSDGGGVTQIDARAADTDGGSAEERRAGSAADGGAGKNVRKQSRAAETPAPEPRDGRKFARVFMSGRSQAVRLPKEFRFDVDRVIIRREGRHVVLSPPFKDWDDYFKNSTPLPDDFEEIIAEMRREELPLEEREPFD